METEPSMPQQRPIMGVPLKLGTIPKQLKVFDRWCLWKYTWKEKTRKWAKTPHSALNGHAIDATNLDNGVSFMKAAAAWRAHKGKFNGLGFLLGAGIAGIDVDDCIDENGNLDERGQRMSLTYAGTYAEISPSGRGFKIIVDVGNDPKLRLIGTQHGGMEIYGGKRYFTVTGALLPGHPRSVATMLEAFARTAEEMGVNKHLQKVAAAADGPADFDDLKQKSGFDYRAAREMIDHMPFRWIDDYHTWLRGGMALHHEFDGAPEALELWDEWSSRNPDPKKYQDGACAEKWEGFGKKVGQDLVTMRTLVRDAQTAGWRAPSTVARAIQDFTILDDNPGAGTDSDWWVKYSVGPMLKTTPQPLDWVWSGLLLKAKVLVLAGSGGSSKSYLMLAAATQYAIGNSWGPFQLPEADPAGRVLVLYGEEDQNDVHHRIHSLQHTFMLSDEQIQQVSERMAVLPLRGQNISLAEYDRQERTVQITAAMTRLEGRVKQYDVRLMVLDPMALLHGLEENDNHAIGEFVRQLDAMCLRTGCAVVLIHHFSKAIARAREVNESNVRGASSLVNHVRSVVVMHRLRRDESAEWGVPEEDHARWVMFNVVKNNYGHSGVVTWFNVNQANGVVSPSDTQLTFMNSRDIRTAIITAQQQDAQEQENDLTQAEERRARIEAERNIQILRFMELILREAVSHYAGVLPSVNACRELLLSEDASATASHSRVAWNRIRERGFVSEQGRQFVINDAGQQWLEEREILS